MTIFAQEEEKEKGFKGPITKEEIFSLFKKNEVIDGYVIDGDFVIDFLKKDENKDYDIKIRNSIITDGLDFTELDELPLGEMSLPEDWNENQKEEFLEERKGASFHVVKNHIEITYSEIANGENQSIYKYAFSINAANTFFYNNTNFSGTTFTKYADFIAAYFNKYADFSSAYFNKYAYFSSANFNKYALFSSAIFNTSADFIAAYFNKYADFSSAYFNKYAHFRSANFNTNAKFSSANFKIAIFRSAIFNKDATFSSANFNDEADFFSANFKDKAHFGRTNFKDEADFSSAYFKDEADFFSANFKDEADFSSAYFNTNADFIAAYFNKYADFSSAYFKDEADFFLANFNKYADFSSATFYGLSYFKEAKFEILLLDSTLFKKYADFRETLIGQLNFQNTSPTVIEGRIDFRKAIIVEAHFQDIIFEKDVDFSDATFGFPYFDFSDATFANFGVPEKDIIFNRLLSNRPFVVFQYVTFESYAYFIRSTFSCNTAFERINFKNDANFTDVVFNWKKRKRIHKFSFSYLDFKNIFVTWDNLPDFRYWVSESKERIKSFVNVKKNENKKVREENLQPLTSVLSSLEENFRNQNNLKDTNQTNYYRKAEELKYARNGEDVWPRILKEADMVFWYPSFYATSNLWIGIWCSGFYSFFVIFYYFLGAKFSNLKEEKKDEFSFKLRIFNIPRDFLGEHEQKVERRFLASLLFSFVLCFKVGYRDVKISGKKIDYKYIVLTQWILGYWLLINLVVTLSNTVPLAHRLLSGIF